MDDETIQQKVAYAASKALRMPGSSKAARSATGSALAPTGPITPTSMKIAYAAKKALQRLGPRKEAILVSDPADTQYPDDKR
jgi:hypothetical protein